MSEDTKSDKKDYEVGEILVYSLDEIEKEVLGDVAYLDVFAGSDIRIKENVKPLERPLEKALLLKPIVYNWKDGIHPDSEVEDIGLSAQEVEKVFPQFVRENEKGIKHVNYSKLSAVLLGAIHELNEKVDKLSK